MIPSQQKIYKTKEIADYVGVHPNTVRLYEEWGFIPPVERSGNGYRMYTEAHLEQMILARIAFRLEFSAGGLREKLTEIVKIAATGDFEKAHQWTLLYQIFLKNERYRARKAIEMAQTWSVPIESEHKILNRQEAAMSLGVSIDVLRNWELNGLIEVPRDPRSRYRQYGPKEMSRLELIRLLRMANHSLMAILRMLKQIDQPNLDSNSEPKLDCDFEPESELDVASDLTYATDQWVKSLGRVQRESKALLNQIVRMKSMNQSTPSMIR